MSSTPWRGTVLFTAIVVIMGATVGLKLYGVGQDVVAASTSVHSTTTGGATSDTSSGGATTTATPDRSAPAPATPSPFASASTASTTVTGSSVDTRYGAVQVEVTFSGTAITAVKTLQSPDRDGRDIEINDQALPILEQEVLSSQSANIDTVSGATYTSEGYIRSVQSAIDHR